MERQRGFTLVELMIVVAIIAILAAIALPAYKMYVATEGCMVTHKTTQALCDAARAAYRAAYNKEPDKDSLIAYAGQYIATSTNDLAHAKSRAEAAVQEAEQMKRQALAEASSNITSQHQTVAEALQAKQSRVYVENRMETAPLSLQRHYDGKLYACSQEGQCFPVQE